MNNRVPLDKNAYSEESKNSVGWEFLGEEYKDKKYKCTKCRKKAVFLAEDQKKYYEVKKKYMWTKRTLCPKCWGNMQKVRLELDNLDKEFLSNKRALQDDSEFLKYYLHLLKEYPTYGKSPNSSKIASIENAITNLSST